MHKVNLGWPSSTFVGTGEFVCLGKLMAHD